MPTGSGKTKTAMELIYNLFNNSKNNPVVLWLAQSEELCEQAIQAFIDVWNKKGNKDVRLCRLWGNHSIPQSVSIPILVVASFQKLNNVIKKDLLKTLRSRTEMVIVDEAHRSIAPTYKNVIQYLTDTKNKLIGLSATPSRNDEDETKDLLDLFNKNYAGIKISEKYNVIEYLQNQGVLCLLKTEPIVTNLKFDLTKTEKIILIKI